jgi:hypothetical protein
MSNHDDDLARLLRDALREEAGHVHPAGDGLQRIRARTASRRPAMPWFFRPAVAGAALVLTLLTGFVAGLVLAGPGETWKIGPAVIGEAEPTPTPTIRSPSPSPSPSPTAPAPSVYAAPVYWLGDVGGRLALYREFQSVPGTGAPIRDAVTAMVRGQRADPDYMTVWPRGTTVRGISTRGDIVTVDLSAEAAGAHAPPETARMSMQQLAWTVTAAAKDVRLKVLLRIDGEPVTDLWDSGVSAEQPVGRGESVDVLAPVWILNPVQGATVGRTFTLEGLATVFEANVSIEVRRGDEVVHETFATASIGAPGRGEWSTTLTLEPGTYELRAFESSAEDGRPLYVDSKQITVR